MSQEFRFVVFGVRKGVKVNATTGAAEKTFSSLQRGYDWVCSVTKYPDVPVYAAFTWNEAEKRDWAITIKPNWSYRFITC